MAGGGVETPLCGHTLIKSQPRNWDWCTSSTEGKRSYLDYMWNTSGADHRQVQADQPWIPQAQEGTLLQAVWFSVAGSSKKRELLNGVFRLRALRT